jgi:FkbM family methyltransferase
VSRFISYAQNREDVILGAYFNDIENGTYVDIGAHHPVNDSVTKHFYDKGWRGINVEPIQEIINLLNEYRPDDINVLSGISNQNGNLKLRVYVNSGLSTFSEEKKKMYSSRRDENTNEHRDVIVPVITLEELFKRYPLEHIHFMKIDVEGYEYEVLEGNNWSKYRPEIICISADRKIKDWRPILVNNDYELTYNDGLNDYYVAIENKKREKMFSYPEVMLLGDQVLPYHVAITIDELRESKKEEALKMQILNIKVGYLINENKLLSHKLVEQRRVKNATRILLLAVDKAVRSRIESLKDQTKQVDYHQLKDINIDSKLSEPKQLVKKLQKIDLETYYSADPINDNKTPPLRILIYYIARTIYLIPRKFIRMLIKLTVKKKHE